MLDGSSVPRSLAVFVNSPGWGNGAICIWDSLAEPPVSVNSHCVGENKLSASALHL
jgi:hypothetical protein